MRAFISVRLASLTVMSICVLALLLHGLILLRLIPYDFVWGGRLQTESALFLFESISISLQLVFLLAAAIRGGYLLRGRFAKTAAAVLWIMSGLMALNTLGNLLSLSQLEAIVMTPVTALLAVLSLRLALQP